MPEGRRQRNHVGESEGGLDLEGGEGEPEPPPGSTSCPSHGSHEQYISNDDWEWQNADNWDQSQEAWGTYLLEKLTSKEQEETRKEDKTREAELPGWDKEEKSWKMVDGKRGNRHK